MEIQHLQMKIPLTAPGPDGLGPLIPIFHRWVEHPPQGELLVDVADYRHIPGGPGVMLVGHLANYGIELCGGGPGLVYCRKAAVEGDNRERLGQAWAALLAAAERLQEEPEWAGGLRFDRRRLQVSINDRLLAPNTAPHFAALKAELTVFFASLGELEEVAWSSRKDPRARLSAALCFRQEIGVPPLPGLADRATGAAAPPA